MKSKICTKCGTEYPATTEFFHKDKKGEYNLRSDCKQCRSHYKKQYYQNNKERLKKYRKDYYQDHKEYEKQTSKKRALEYYWNNREKVLDKIKIYQKTEEGKEVMKKAHERYLYGNNSLPQKYKNGEKKLKSRFIVEKFLGRDLTVEEIVHHINGNPFNTDITNLYLCKSQREHMALHRQKRRIQKILRSLRVENIEMNGLVI